MYFVYDNQWSCIESHWKLTKQEMFFNFFHGWQRCQFWIKKSSFDRSHLVMIISAFWSNLVNTCCYIFSHSILYAAYVLFVRTHLYNTNQSYRSMSWQTSDCGLSFTSRHKYEITCFNFSRVNICEEVEFIITGVLVVCNIQTDGTSWCP